MSIISQEPPSMVPKVENIEVVTASTSSSAPQQEIDLQKVITDPDEDNSMISTVNILFYFLINKYSVFQKVHFI